MSSSKAAWLRRVPLLSSLDDELLDRLASELTEIEVDAGNWLIREGEVADACYLVQSGRLEVVAEGPPETLIRTMRRGEVLGELALLHQQVRSASVRARRDSHLLRLGRAQFEGLLTDPGFAVALTRAIGAQLAASQAPAVSPIPPRTIGAVPLDDGAPLEEAADLLVTALRRHGTVARLGPEAGQTPAEMLAALERAESASDRVVLVGDSSSPGEEWTDFCVREADSVFALTGGTPSRAWMDRRDALQGCELVVLGPAVSPQLLAALRPREVQVLPEGSDLQPSVDLTARRLSGNAIGIVLSGGGAKAFAHLGVLDELISAGVLIDRIGGTSLGALVAAGIADGQGMDRILEVFRGGFIGVNPTTDYTLPLYSLIRGERTRGLIEEFLGGSRIEELRRRFFCVSFDLNARETVIHRTGRLADAVRASLSIPGVFPPISTPDGRLLVDGGVLDNLPVGTMAERGEGPVIAVDVTGQLGNSRKSARPGIARLVTPVRRYLTGSDAQVPRLGETVVRTVMAGSMDTAEGARRHADLVIQPPVEQIGLLAWQELESIVEAGRAAAREILQDAPAWLLGPTHGDVDADRVTAPPPGATKIGVAP